MSHGDFFPPLVELGRRRFLELEDLPNGVGFLDFPTAEVSGLEIEASRMRVPARKGEVLFAS